MKTAARKIVAFTVALVTMGGAAHAALVNHWQIEEGAGATTADAVGGKTGTLTNGPTWVASGLAPISTTAALSFDGADDHVVATGYKGVTGTTPRTAAFWMKAGSTQLANSTMFSWGNNAANGNRFDIRLDNGRLRVEVQGGFEIADTINLTTTDEWHHVAVTWASGGVHNVNIYLDGTLQGVFSQSASNQTINTASGDDLRFGASIHPDGSRWFNGLLDDVRLYDHVLSGAEIQTLATATPEIPAPAALPAGLVLLGLVLTLRRLN